MGKMKPFKAFRGDLNALLKAPIRILLGDFFEIEIVHPCPCLL